MCCSKKEPSGTSEVIGEVVVWIKTFALRQGPNIDFRT